MLVKAKSLGGSALKKLRTSLWVVAILIFIYGIVIFVLQFVGFTSSYLSMPTIIVLLFDAIVSAVYLGKMYRWTKEQVGKSLKKVARKNDVIIAHDVVLILAVLVSVVVVIMSADVEANFTVYFGTLSFPSFSPISLWCSF